MATDTQDPPRTMADLNKIIKHDMTPDPSWEATGEIHRDSAGGRWPVYRERITENGRVAQRDADGGIMYHLAADGSKRRAMWQEEKVGLWYLSAEHEATVLAGQVPMFKGTSDDVRRRSGVLGHLVGAYPLRVADFERIEEFTYVPLGNSICQKNRNFRPAASELERQREADAERNAVSEIGRALRESGRTFADLLTGVKAAVGIEPREEKPVEGPSPSPKPSPVAQDVYPRGAGSGAWFLSAAHELACQAGNDKPFYGNQAKAVTAANARATAEAAKAAEGAGGAETI